MLNRVTIFSAIEQEIARGNAEPGQLAIMLVRTHGLREASLRFGYQRGEQLEHAAQRLIEAALRPVDRVFRSGDNSFIVLLPRMRNGNHVLLAATRLIGAFEAPLGEADTVWRVQPVIGIAMHPEHGGSADLLCRRAEIAHDEARRRGEQTALYHPEQTRVEILHEELRDAIEGNRLRVHLQPIWQLASGALAGAESLARWTSRRHGDVSAADFVPFAEHSGLIAALTRWSINATLRHVATIPDKASLGFAINVSPRAFSEPGLVEQILDALDIWGLPPNCLIAEITETALVNDVDLSVRIMRRLRDQGVRIAIDDFGTGYASFSYLRRFPATELKIDMSLVSDMCRDQRTSRLVQAMIDMAHHLDMVAVAEGIEDQATRDRLADMGCDLGQGFHLGRPQAAEQFIERYGAPASDRTTDTT